VNRAIKIGLAATAAAVAWRAWRLHAANSQIAWDQAAKLALADAPAQALTVGVGVAVAIWLIG